jgi:hypothetical protein
MERDASRCTMRSGALASDGPRGSRPITVGVYYVAPHTLELYDLEESS